MSTPALTVHEAADATGWSPRMLRYVEKLGLVETPRSPAGYRLYGPSQLVRLRALRSLLEEHGLELGDVAVAARLRREPELRSALDGWFEAAPAPALSAPSPAPEESLSDWLAFEQSKHQSLLTQTPHS
jgi:MerR family transcriptional regulator, copper efflux regulator